MGRAVLKGSLTVCKATLLQWPDKGSTTIHAEDLSVIDDIHAIMVTLHIGGGQALFIMLGSDGSITRVGNGSQANVERDMFIGMTGPELFVRLRNQITPDLVGWCGERRADPNPEGEACDLVIAFKRADGQDLKTGWLYGSESQGPPPEVCKFVVAAVEATNPWFEQQKAMVSGNSE